MHAVVLMPTYIHPAHIDIVVVVVVIIIINKRNKKEYHLNPQITSLGDIASPFFKNILKNTMYTIAQEPMK